MPWHTSVERTVWCDACHEWEQLPARTLRALVRQVVARGWTLRKGVTRCPTCSKTMAPPRDDAAAGDAS